MTSQPDCPIRCAGAGANIFLAAFAGRFRSTHEAPIDGAGFARGHMSTATDSSYDHGRLAPPCVRLLRNSGVSNRPCGRGSAARCELRRQCVERTVQVAADGSWLMPNVPSNMGRIRARATCTQDDATVSGQTDYFTVVRDGVASVGEMHFAQTEPVPVRLAYFDPAPLTLTTVGATHQLRVRATYPDGSATRSRLQATARTIVPRIRQS